MRIFDTFLFFNELELLELRLATLWDTVDYFVITEATVTFSGKAKPLYFQENRERFKKYESKIIHNPIANTPERFDTLSPTLPHHTPRQVSFPHKSGGVPLEKLSTDFQREVFQRDSIIHGLLHAANDDDLVLVSDLDEIPNPHAIKAAVNHFEPGTIYTLCQRWYMYYLNVQTDQEWFGTRLCSFHQLKQQSVDLMRHHLEDRTAQPGPVIENGGWHFSFLGGAERIKQKLDAYSYQGRRTKWLLKALDTLFPSRIERKLKNNLDIFASQRVFQKVPLDDSFPPALISDAEKYGHLIQK